MASMINTNIASLSAQRNLSKSQDSLNNALQRLSSGLRINSAKDDAAGLAISTRMTSQINGMNQAIRNANDGISLSQTADSSLDEVTNNLQRIRDLALQAANGSNSSDDRKALDVEVQQRLAEVNRIAAQTTFNGINLLDGSFKSQQFQIGASANQTVTIDSIGSAKTSDLGLGAGTTSGSNLSTAVATTGIAAGSLKINDTTVATDATTNSAKALAAAINGNATIAASGVTATASNTFASTFTSVAVTKAGQIGSSLGTTVPSVQGANVSSSGVAVGTLSINGSVITTSAASTTSAKALATAINAQASVTGVNATAQTTTTSAADSLAFKNGSVTLASGATNTFALSVGGVQIYAATNDGNGTSTITAAALDGDDLDVTNTSASTGGLGSSTVQAALAAAGITYSGSAVAGTLQFQAADGSNLAISETIGVTNASGTSFVTGQADVNVGTNTVTNTSSVKLTSASAIEVSGSSVATSGLVNGTYGGMASIANVQGNVTSGTMVTATDLVINGTGIATVATDAKTLAANINLSSQTTGVNAVADPTLTTSADSLAFKNGSITMANTGTLALSVGGVNILQVTATGATSAITAANLDGNSVAITNGTLGAATGLGSATVQANLAAAGITFTGTAAAGNLQFKAADGSNIAITETVGVVVAAGTSFVTGGDVTSLGADSVTRRSSITLNSDSAIVVTGNDNGTKSGIANGTYSPSTASKLTLNGTAIALDSTTVGADKVAAAINLQTTTTGVTATALATDTGAMGSFTTTSTAGYGLSVNGVKVIDSATSVAGTSAASIDAALATTGTGSVGANLAAAGITTTGTAAAGTLRFLSASGANINVVETQGGTDLAGFGKIAATTASQFSSTVTLSSSNAITVGGSVPSAVGLSTGTNNIVNQQGSKLSSTVVSSGIAAGSLSINGTTITTSAATTSAKALADAINAQKDTTGVTATVGTTSTSATLFGGDDAASFSNVSTAGGSTYALSVGSVTIATQAASIAAGSGVTRASIDTALATTGVGSVGANLAAAGITFTGSATRGDLQFFKTDGSNLAVTEAVTGTVTGGVGKGAGVANTGGTVETATAAVSLSSSSNITVAGNSPSALAGLTAGTVGANKQYSLTVGDGSASETLSFDLSQGQFGTSVKATDIASAINSNADIQAMKISAAIDADGKLALTSADGRNITLQEATNDRVNFAVAGTSGFADSDAGSLTAGGVPAADVTHVGKIDLTSTKELTIAGTDATLAGLKAGSFAGANVLSVEAANATLTAIDEALNTLSSTRASLGAYQNRFASTVANLTANAESLTASRSRILDADFAAETANLTRGQILQQAGTAMLAQANQLPNGVLSLLRG